MFTVADGEDLFFNAKSLQIRGKSQSYMMKWESVKKLFQLDLPGNQKLVVIGLSTPIRYGKMLYNLLGMTFDSSTTVDTAEAVPKAAWDAAGSQSQAGFDKKRDNAIQEDSEEAPKWDVACGLLKELSGCRLPQPVSFEGADGAKGVTCTFVTDRGHLFFFQKQFIFVKKPILWKMWSDVIGIEFRDTPLRQSSFDLKFLIRDSRPVEFTQIQKEDQKKLFELLEKIPDAKDKIRNPDEVRNSFKNPRRVEDDPTLAVSRSGRKVGKAQQTWIEEDDDDDYVRGSRRWETQAMRRMRTTRRIPLRPRRNFAAGNEESFPRLHRPGGIMLR
eukprot:s36_g12.t1